MQIEITRHDSTRPAEKPFMAAVGFNAAWWNIGLVKGPIAWCSARDPKAGEIARAQIKIRSFTGEAYPSRHIPPNGATEIDFLEVRVDLRGGGRAIGRSFLAMIKEEFPGPYVALSLDESSDGFWRRLGWVEHDHPEAAEYRARGGGVPAVLFETP